MLRIVIAEDAVLQRDGLSSILTRFGHHVVAAVGEPDALVHAVDQTRPDVVVTDVRMPPDFTDEGLRAAVTIRVRHPKLPILVLSAYIAKPYAARLLETAGETGVGYLLKDRVSQVEDFVAAVEQVAAGGCVIDPDVVAQLLARGRNPVSRLTPREREVLALMAQGRANAAIARDLVVTEAAVAKHINAIFTKLDLDPAGDDHRRVRAVLTYLGAADRHDSRAEPR